MKTKTLLALLSAILACALPVTFAADAAGVALPTALDALRVFSAFVLAVVLMTVSKDYGRTGVRFVSSTRAMAPATPARVAKASHPLAA